MRVFFRCRCFLQKFFLKRRHLSSCRKTSQTIWEHWQRFLQDGIFLTSVLVWVKGSATDSLSLLTAEQTSDSLSWTNVTTILPLPTTGTTYRLKIQNSSIHLRFTYTKSAGNLAFDDFVLLRDGILSSNGWIKVYFNHPVNNSVSNGVNAIYLNQTIDDTLVRYIDSAKYSVDVAVYNYSQSASIADISGAINSAYNRGVKIRWIIGWRFD